MSDQSIPIGTRSSPRLRKSISAPATEKKSSQKKESKNVRTERRNPTVTLDLDANVTGNINGGGTADTTNGSSTEQHLQESTSTNGDVLDDNNKHQNGDESESKVKGDNDETGAETKKCSTVVEGTKTPPAMQSSPPPTTNSSMRASTRKRRTAAPQFTDNSASTDGTAKVDTPPIKQRKSSSATPKGRTKVAKRVPPINLDEDDAFGKNEDPYNFSTQSGIHPEPLKNISIERSSFGEIKFTKSLPSSADRYANVEKIAAGRNPQLAASLSASNSDRPSSLAQLSSLTSSSLRLELSGSDTTPKNTTRASTRSFGTSGKKRTANKRNAAEDDDTGMEDDQHETVSSARKRAVIEKTPITKSNTAKPQSAKREQYWPSAANKSEKKVKDAEIYKVPELSAEEQFAVDHPAETHHLLSAGARVLALWGYDYYAANICGREALGRYYVHFVEDDLNRILPPSGVIPISALVPGTKLSFIDLVDGDEIGKVCEVVSPPSANAAEWLKGQFVLRELDEEFKPSQETQIVSWTKFYLSKEQGSQIVQEGKVVPVNSVQDVDRENIVSESRASRRSRSTNLSTSSLGTFETSKASPQRTPKNTSANKSPGTRSGVRTRTSQVSQEAINEEEKRQKDSEAKVDVNGEKREEPMDVDVTNAQSSKPDTDQPKQSPEPLAGDAPAELSKLKSLSVNEQAKKNTPIFAGLKFVLTSANRPNKKATDFNKRDYRKKIEERVGRIIEDFSALEPGDTAYLIADTYYRTHKYLSALSLSVPCVSYVWIQECVSQNTLIDYQQYLLPAGESSLGQDQVFEWKPLKGALFAGKRMAVYSTLDAANSALALEQQHSAVVSFGEIWAPILRNLGATVVGDGPGEPFPVHAKQVAAAATALADKLAFYENANPPIDILLTESDCERELAELAQNKGGLAVSSEWVIQAIVTGTLPQLNCVGGERFRYDFV